MNEADVVDLSPAEASATDIGDCRPNASATKREVADQERQRQKEERRPKESASYVGLRQNASTTKPESLTKGVSDERRVADQTRQRLMRVAAGTRRRLNGSR